MGIGLSLAGIGKQSTQVNDWVPCSDESRHQSGQTRFTQDPASNWRIPGSLGYDCLELELHNELFGRKDRGRTFVVVN